MKKLLTLGAIAGMLGVILIIPVAAHANRPSNYQIEAAKYEAWWYWSEWRGFGRGCGPVSIRFVTQRGFSKAGLRSAGAFGNRCRIYFNTGVKWWWSRFATVMIHEYGHARYDLNHRRDRDSIMWWSEDGRRGPNWSWSAGGLRNWWSVPRRPYGCLVKPLPAGVSLQDQPGC